MSSFIEGNRFNKNCLAVSGMYFVNSKLEDNPISHQQSKAQVEFFKEALDEFGATSPEQVIRLWAKAEETRNGVYHYAVSCDNLKAKISQQWGEAKDNFWIIGASSPWLEKYEVIYNKKINNKEYDAKIKFYWATSTGPSEPTETILKIVKNRDKWCVVEARERGF